MKVLVTGGSGFCGIHLMKGLLDRKYEVRNLDIADIDESRIEKRVKFIKADIRDEIAVNKACEDVDAVFHNAAVLPVSRSKKRTFWSINVDGTRVVLEASLRNRVKKVIFISSSSVYGIPREVPITEAAEFNPVGDYGRSKVEAERICNLYREKGLEVVILRPRTIVGTGRLGIFQILYSRIADGKNIYIIGKGDNLFQFLSVADLVQVCLLVMEKPCQNEDFNVGTDVFGTVKQDLRDLTSYANTNSSLIPIPASGAKAILGALDRLGLSPLVSWHYLTPDRPFYFDITRAENFLGFQPEYSNIQMLRESYDWYSSHRKAVDSEFGITHRRSVRQRILKVLR